MPNKPRSLRRSVRGEKRRNQSKGWKGGWRDRLNIPKANTTDILLCAGSYEDIREDVLRENDGMPVEKHYHVHPNHTFKNGDLFRSSPCPRGYDNDAADCVFCDGIDHGDKRVGRRRDQFSMNVIHFDIYKRMPVINREGKTLKYEDDREGHHKRGDTIMSWQLVTKARDRQDAVDDLESGSPDVVAYRKKYITVGSSHLQNIMEIDKLAGKRCACGGQLSPVEFTCQNCGEVIANVLDRNLGHDDIVAFEDDRQRCQHCGYFGFADIVSECHECDTPTPLTGFNVVASVRKSGEGTSSTIVVEKITPVFDYELPDGSSIVEIDDEGYVVEGPDGEPYVLTENVKKLADNQFDFDSVHKPLNNDYMAQLRGVDNPYARSNRRGSGRYSKSETRYGNRNSQDGEKESDKEETTSRKRPAKKSPVRRKRRG